MASTKRRVAGNAPGDLFVDDTCIDCDTCRWMAPSTFDRHGEQARVWRQPASGMERERALEALVSCPTGSIGTEQPAELGPARAAFPKAVDGPVHHCGYHAKASFGAASWWIRRERGRGGSVLIDSPRFAAPLVERLGQEGGVATLALTHVDDVADHEKFRERFGCGRVMHEADAVDGIELVVRGRDPVALDDDLLAIPVPGHTRGSMCFLYRETYLFTGDHLAWSPRLGHLYAFRSACWYDWSEQVASMERLARHRFEWVLPGHGRMWHGTAAEAAVQMQRCLEWMRKR